MENSIYDTHQAYLARHGGKGAMNPDSKHRAIEPKRVEDFRDERAVLGTFGEDGEAPLAA
jgi:hypothetical protein